MGRGSTSLASLLSVAAAVCTQGCMQTGREWVHAPFEETEDMALAPTPRARFAVEPSDTFAPEPPPSSARLRKTITLGETLTPTASGGPSDGPPANAPATTFAPNDYGYSYGGYGYGYAAPFTSRGAGRGGQPRSRPSRSSTTGMRPGQDWATPPSYGPAFPYSTAPASPWRR